MTHEQNLVELVRPLTEDVTKSIRQLNDRLDRIERRAEAVKMANARPVARLGGDPTGGEHSRYARPASGQKGLVIAPEDRAALSDYITKGVISGAVDSEGGFLVPFAVSEEIERLIERQSPVRRVARVVEMPERDIRFPVANSGMASGWVSEKGARDPTDAPDFFSVVPPGGELYARPEMTLASAEDAAPALDNFIETAVIDEMARREGEAFVLGDGVDKPRGFLAGPAPVATGDDSRAVGTLQYIPTGAASTLGSDLIGKLVAMVMAMKPGYRQAPGCAWLMSTAVLADIANLKDSQGRPLYLPSLREGVPGQLLGYDVIEAEHMPGVGAGNFPIAFGNWQRGYIIGDRTPLSVLRDPYTRPGWLRIYFRKRVHGAVLNSECIKLLKVAAS